MHGTLDLFQWTEAKIDLLKRLIEGKLSSGQTAKEMGTSRGSVVGKAFRLGLRFQSPTVTNSRKSTEMKISRRRERKSLRSSPLPPMAPEPDALRLSVVELEASHCRWPVTEDHPFLFCGHEKAAGFSYCAHHCGIAYIAPEARHRAPRPR